MGEKYFIRVIRTTLFVVCVCQLVSTVERQVFDFLGYMWAPIIGNFLQIIAVILGLFGTCQHYRIFVAVYVVWSLLWLGWNIFVICLYMEVGVLNRNRERYVLTLGAESKSWWLEHGLGCRLTNDSWRLLSPQHLAEASRPIPPEEFVQGCLLHYYYVEVIQAAVQVLLALVGLVVACVLFHAMLEEEDASSPANDELEFVKIRSRAASATTRRAPATPTPATTTTSFDNLAFSSDAYEDNDSLRRAYRLPPPGGPRPYEQPPSYDTTMRNTTTTTTTTTTPSSTEAETRAANLFYAADRHSVRSKASTRSKRSTAPAPAPHRGGNQASSRSRRSVRSRGGDQGRGPQDLPWVRITPSTSGSVMDGHSRHWS